MVDDHAIITPPQPQHERPREQPHQGPHRGCLTASCEDFLIFTTRIFGLEPNYRASKYCYPEPPLVQNIEDENFAERQEREFELRDRVQEWALTNPDIGMFSLAYVSFLTAGSWVIPVLLLGVVFVQLMVAVLFFYDQSKQYHSGFCPAIMKGDGAGNTARLMAFAIAVIYVIKLTFLYLRKLADVQSRVALNYPSNGKGNGPVKIFISLDRIMSLLYELLMYLCNLWVVFITSKPLDMIVNALALEFILLLDDVVKELYLKTFPPKVDNINNRWTFQDAWNDNPIGKTWWNWLRLIDLVVLILAILPAIPVCMAVVYLPLCKPK